MARLSAELNFCGNKLVKQYQQILSVSQYVQSAKPRVVPLGNLFLLVLFCWYDSEKRPDLRGGFMLCFLDDGTGMDPSEYVDWENQSICTVMNVLLRSVWHIFLARHCFFCCTLSFQMKLDMSSSLGNLARDPQCPHTLASMAMVLNRKSLLFLCMKESKVYWRCPDSWRKNLSK